ncbi:dephospho-CoA kinase [Quadrisphaera sp. DSM 44207]|uniref:dephospho-CoA kinase n=1 Tax=Quadrisphaera sp. DSM 44207 TaxID=1881057 RepID=UPI00088C0F49|nr:dephospho-CoA kinase [Quadrisphaera sp. DSM 44207]SDQ44898.1 dephospho-CoA kinase [Quadrisphaera sp. DSM 44207]
MLRVGLTGGVGAGKSTVARQLAALGAVVVDADALAREVVAPGTEGLAAVVEEFGPGVLRADGALDRAALARVVFEDAERRRALEAVTHPRIAARTEQLVAAAPADAVVVHDIPLLVELGRGDRYHLVVVVAASAEERVRRLVTERGTPEDDARARVAAQATDEQRRAAADVELDNAGVPAGLAERVERLWRERLVPFEANLRAGVRAPRPDQPVLVPADPAWAAAGARLAARVRRAAGERALDVQHTGSTAVPGLDAKDVIDLQVVVADLPTAREVAADLAAAGLVAVPGEWADEPVTAPGRPVPRAFAANADPGRAVDCSVRVAGSPAVAEALAFRDRLRADAGERAAYAALKHELAARTWPSADAYARAKTAFIAGVLARAGA